MASIIRASFLLAACMLVDSGIMLWLGRQMWAGTLAPNAWAGVRTKKALKSDAAWYAVQKQCAPGILALGLAYFDTAVLFAVQAACSETVSILVPSTMMIAQSIVGIAFVYMSEAKLKEEDIG